MAIIDSKLSDNLNKIYTAFVFGTTGIGLITLVSGVSTEDVEPIVLSGAIVVGTINVYWLTGASGAY